MEEVRRLFKPEFLNRIDDIIVFHPLNREHMKEIAGIMLKTIEKRSQAQLHLTLNVTDQAKEFLIEKGYDEKYGARPLRRTIQNLLEDKLAEEILDGSIKEGDTVLIDAADGALNFSAQDETKH